MTDGEYEFEVDVDGSGNWLPAGVVGPGGCILPIRTAEWVRFRAKRDVEKATVALCLRACDPRSWRRATLGYKVALGENEKALLHVNAIDPKKLSLSVDGKKGYQLDADLALSDCPAAAGAVVTNVPLAKTTALREDAASLIYTDDNGNVFRLPRNWSGAPMSTGRICREVCTERDIFCAGGLLYELPAENAHGFFGVRPICQHGLQIYDYASWRGLFVMSLPGELRLMAVDDLWQLCKPAGVGGPWKNSAAKAGVPSDIYLMNGFDQKTLVLSADKDVTVSLEVDIDGWGTWVKYADYELQAGARQKIRLAESLGGYWARVTASADCTATAQFTYD